MQIVQVLLLRTHVSRRFGDRSGDPDLSITTGVRVDQLVPVPAQLRCRRAGETITESDSGRRFQSIYTAATEDAASERFLEFSEARGGKYPAIVQLWSDA